jgi:hypothetical protein
LHGGCYAGGVGVDGDCLAGSVGGVVSVGVRIVDGGKVAYSRMA